MLNSRNLAGRAFWGVNFSMTFMRNGLKQNYFLIHVIQSRFFSVVLPTGSPCSRGFSIQVSEVKFQDLLGQLKKKSSTFDSTMK